MRIQFKQKIEGVMATNFEKECGDWRLSESGNLVLWKGVGEGEDCFAIYRSVFTVEIIEPAVPHSTADELIQQGRELSEALAKSGAEYPPELHTPEEVTGEEAGAVDTRTESAGDEPVGLPVVKGGSGFGIYMFLYLSFYFFFLLTVSKMEKRIHALEIKAGIEEKK